MVLSKHYVYRLTNTVNGKIYIGKAKDPRARFRKHISSAKLKKPDQFFYLQASIRKYGADKFALDIVECLGSAEKAYAREMYWVGYYKSNNNKYGMNLTLGGDGSRGHILSKSARMSISKAQTGRKMPECTRRAIVKANKGRHYSAEHRKKIGDAQQGNKNHRYGKKNTAEHNLAISRANTGKVVSDETRQKMRVATTARFKNSPMPESTRQKLREARIGKAGLKGSQHPGAKLTENDVLEIRRSHREGVKYADLSRRFGVARGTIGKIVQRVKWQHLP